MGFNDLSLGPADQATLGQLKSVLRLPDYHPAPGRPAAPDQIYENLDSDPQIPDQGQPARPASRGQLITALRGSSTPIDCLQKGNRFCWDHSQEGARVDDVDLLGHVHDFGKLADWLHDAASGLSRTETRTWLRDLVHLPGDEDTRLAEQQAAIDKDSLAAYQMWSFYESGDQQPFTGLNPVRSELVNRLGLGHLADPTLELVYWSNELPSDLEAKRPTAWDAGLASPWWRPSGKTEPLDGSARGLPEVVHDPIGPRHLATSIAEPEI